MEKKELELRKREKKEEEEGRKVARIASLHTPKKEEKKQEGWFDINKGQE